MANNVESELVNRIKDSWFYSLQIEETPDVSNEAELIYHFRYEFNNDIHKDLLFSKTFQTDSTGKHIFEVLNEYMQEYKIWLEKMRFCSDGTCMLTGCN